jgi:hypothetical protein
VPITTFAALISAIPVTWSGESRRGSGYHQGGRAGQNRKAAEFTLLLRTMMCLVRFLLKGSPLQLLKISRLVISANRRSGILPGPVVRDPPDDS